MEGARKVIYAALAGNLAIAGTKFVAAAITGSSAMFSEGVHSVVDTGNQALLLYGMRRASRPPDERFPYGHGKEIYFWSFVVALLVFALGAGVSFYQGVQGLRSPEPMQNPAINYAVLAFAALFEGGSWLVALREFRSKKGRRGYLEAVRLGKDPRTFAVLFEDTAALVILAVTAFLLARETKGLLIGESANREVVAEICRLASRYREIAKVHEVLTMHVGPEFILANIALEIRPDLPRDRTHDIIESLTRDIRRSDDRVKRVFIGLRDED